MVTWLQQHLLFVSCSFTHLCASSVPFEDSGLRKERRRKKKITNIISFDDDDPDGEEPYEGVRSPRKGLAVTATPTAVEGAATSAAVPVPVGQGSPEENLDLIQPLEAQEALEPSPAQNGLLESGIVGWATTPPHNGAPLDTKSIDNEEEDEDEDVYGKGRPAPQEESGSTDQWVLQHTLSIWLSVYLFNNASIYPSHLII